jgi:hypothetical protein
MKNRYSYITAANRGCQPFDSPVCNAGLSAVERGKKPVNLDERNEKIWKMSCEGATLSQIGREFDISSDRVRQICFKKKSRIENASRWPFLKIELPMRAQNVLRNTFGNEDIFHHPEKLASLGEATFYTWKNLGKKSIKSLIDILESHGYSVNRSVRMSDMKCQGYFDTGKTILQKYFDYYRNKSLDDTEYLPVVRLIIEGITEEMSSAGMLMPYCDEVAGKLKAFNCSLYRNRWIEQLKEDQDPDDPFDLEKEYELAQNIFDYIYEHGEHPE